MPRFCDFYPGICLTTEEKAHLTGEIEGDHEEFQYSQGAAEIRTTHLTNTR
jgi:hypothetical protein